MGKQERAKILLRGAQWRDEPSRVIVWLGKDGEHPPENVMQLTPQEWEELQPRLLDPKNYRFVPASMHADRGIAKSTLAVALEFLSGFLRSTKVRKLKLNKTRPSAHAVFASRCVRPLSFCRWLVSKPARADIDNTALDLEGDALDMLRLGFSRRAVRFAIGWRSIRCMLEIAGPDFMRFVKALIQVKKLFSRAPRGE